MPVSGYHEEITKQAASNGKIEMILKNPAPLSIVFIDLIVFLPNHLSPKMQNEPEKNYWRKSDRIS